MTDTQEATQQDIVLHEPGIYFGLDEAVYHRDTALGSTSIKAAAVDIYEFQFDRLYGDELDSEALDFGRAIHARFLEGKEALNEKFCSAMPPELVPENALDTMAELKAFLTSNGVKGLSGKTKPELIKAALEIEPDQPIVSVIKERWEAANAGKTLLKPKRWAQVEAAARWAQRDPLLCEVMKDGTFIGGAPEVSIFYEDRDLRLKARLDQLMRHAILDIKTFAPWFDGNLEGAALKVIDRMHYDIQEACYKRAWHKGKELFAAGKVFGEEPFPGFLEECFDRDEPKWIWIMVKSKGAPQPLVVDWQAKLAMGRARDVVEETITKYIQLRDEFGEDQEWVPARDPVTATDSMLPAYFGL